MKKVIISTKNWNGVHDVTEEKLKEDIINEIYNTSVRLHHSKEEIKKDLMPKSLEQLEKILDELKYNSIFANN